MGAVVGNLGHSRHTANQKRSVFLQLFPSDGLIGRQARSATSNAEAEVSPAIKMVWG